MLLESLSYSEYSGQPEAWSISDLHLGKINLIVGKNASGKTRVLNIIRGMSRLLTGKQRPIYLSGAWDARFFDPSNTSPSTSASRIRYQVEFGDRVVTRERLSHGRQVMFSRAANGTGSLYAAGLKKKINFRVSGDQLIAVSRRDSLQHPYLDTLFEWARSVRHYQFGTDFGKSNATVFLKPPAGMELPAPEFDEVGPTFDATLAKFNDRFKNQVLEDLASIGYECEDIGLTTHPHAFMKSTAMLPEDPLFLYVKEKDLAHRTLQTDMSQGMYRAVAVIILVNAGLLWGTSQTLLIDDIGEGLDFNRSTKLISLLVGKAAEASVQIVLTTNDRFVMNAVPLQHWAVLHREGGTVRVIAAKTKPKLFEDFRFLGLNNFDFFTGQYFLGDTPDDAEASSLR